MTVAMETNKKHLQSKKLTKQWPVSEISEYFRFNDTKFDEMLISAKMGLFCSLFMALAPWISIPGWLVVLLS